MRFYTTKEMIYEKLPCHLKKNNYFLSLINRNIHENDKFLMYKHNNGFNFISSNFGEIIPFSITISKKGTVEMKSESEEESKVKDGRVAPINCNTKVFVTKNKNNNTFTISQRMILTSIFIAREEKNEKNELKLLYIEPKYAKLQKQEKRVYNNDQTLKSITANIYKMESKSLFEDVEKWDETIPIVENLYYIFLDKERALLKYTKIDPNTKKEKNEYFLTKFNIVEKESVDQREKITPGIYDLFYQVKMNEIRRDDSSINNKVMIKRK